MIRACLCLLAGAYALQLSSIHGTPVRFLAGLVLLAVVALVRSPGMLLIVALGVIAFRAAVHFVAVDRIDPAYAGDSILAEVEIVDFPQAREGGVSLLVRPIDDTRLPERIRLRWFEPPVMPRFGDVWRLELRLRRPRGRANPGGFDYEAWLTRERIGATGYVVAGHRNHLRRSGVAGRLGALRQRFVERLGRLYPGDGAAGVLAAIAVGARHLVTAAQWERYARTGTSHLMAISGLHVGLAAGTAYLLVSLACGPIVRRGNVHDLATVAAVAVALLYALVTGLAVPARRATLMIAFAAIALLRRREPRPGGIVGATCCIVVLADPLTTMAPGFLLSFAAVVVLLWIARRDFGPRDRAGQRWLRVPGRAVRRLLSLQVGLLLGLLPLTVLLFHRIAFVAPAVNLFAVPLFSFVTVPLALAGLVLDGPAEPVGDRALAAAAASVRWLEALIAKASLLPGAGWAVPAVEGGAWLLLALVIVNVLVPAGWPGRKVAWLGVAALLLYRPAPPPRGCADIAVLDVGQGLAAAVHTESTTLLYDTGPAWPGGGSSARTTVLPYLRHRGVSRLAYLIVSHADLDHAGGVAAILESVPADAILAGEAFERIPGGAACAAGQRWNVDDVRFRILHPPRSSRHSGNDASCVLVVETGRHRAVLAGDIERRVEEQLVSDGSLGPAAFVLVPHHGSGTSSSSALVTTLDPEVAVVAAGHGNRWGFPKAAVVARWEAVGATVLTTATAGAVGVRLCAEGGIVALNRQRETARRVWHDDAR